MVETIKVYRDAKGQIHETSEKMAESNLAIAMAKAQYDKGIARNKAGKVDSLLLLTEMLVLHH